MKLKVSETDKGWRASKLLRGWWFRILRMGVVIIAFVMILGIYLTQPTCSRNNAPTLISVDPVRLEAHVRMLSETQAPRDYQSRANLNRVATYIEEQFREAGASVEEQPVSIPAGRYKNIIGRFGPPVGAVTVIGAHYDACGEKPGADDNASGVAGLIELAVLYGQHPPSYPVELVAYTLEEPPFFGSEIMGSAWHARSLLFPKREVALMISLEMIGYFKDERGTQDYPATLMHLFYPSRGTLSPL